MTASKFYLAVVMRGLPTSSKNKRINTNVSTANAAAIPHGRKYGNSVQKGAENTLGKLSCGRENAPPITGLRDKIVSDPVSRGL